VAEKSLSYCFSVGARVFAAATVSSSLLAFPNQVSNAARMRKSVRCLLVAALLPVCMATGYGADIQLWGRPIEYWFEQRLPVTMTDPQAVEAFMDLGTNALPFLITVLEHKPSLFARGADQVRKKHPPGPKLLNMVASAMKENDRRKCAAMLIGDLGTNGAQAVPTLMKIWNDPTDDWEVKSRVEQALLAMGDQVAGYLPDFMRAVKSTNTLMREAGIILVGHCGPKARAALPLLRDFVDHGNPSLAGEAAEALWEVDRQTNLALRVFSELLTNRPWTGIKYLAEMGEAARPVVPVLMTHLADTNRNVRLEAEALIRVLDPSALAPINAQIRSDSATNLGKLIADIQSADSATRFEALRAIKMYGPDAKPAIPALIGILRTADYHSYEPRLAADVLGEIGPAASPAAPALIAVLREESYSAIPALGKIGPEAKDALPFLEQKLHSSVPGDRWRAADSIIRIAPQNASATISVLHELEHSPPLQVWYAEVNPDAAPLFFMPDPSSNYFRLAAEVSLWRIGLRKKPPVSEIVAELEDTKHARWTSEWIQLLGDIGPEAETALPALKKFLAPFVYGHREAAIAIRGIDPKEADRLNLPGLLALP
jgi:HEAT repeat protein